MKKNNLWRIIWVVGIYAILVSVLYLVVVYKVKWEDKDLNQYLYFYECSHSICTSTQEPDGSYYSKILCPDDICPYIKEIDGNNLILVNGDRSWIYNYINNKIINDKYLEYRYLNEGLYVARNSDNKEGVIDTLGNVVVEFNYDYIDDYKNEFVVYKKDNRYGIINHSTEIEIDNQYEDVVLINDSLYAYRIDNKYYIASYDTEGAVNSNQYNYVYVTGDNILVVYGNKIDILDTNLRSKLLMNINTYYSYEIEKERDSLNIYSEDGYLYFEVGTEDNRYIQYKYDLIDSKFVN